jgi:general secretion pathway protein D
VRTLDNRSLIALALAAALVQAPVYGVQASQQQQSAPAQQQAAPAQQQAAPAQQQPAPAKPQQPPEAKPQPAAQAAAARTAPARPGFVLNIQGASLIEVVNILAQRLKINYILDPRVKGSVTISTFGEIREVDTRQLLETVLRMNGAAMVQVGDIYRIVPIAEAGALPIMPQVDPKTFPEDDRLMLNMVFLKYATVGDLSNLLKPFLGEGAQMTIYEPANLLLILDNSRNMRRTMELIAMFDSDVLAGQRVRLFEVKHGRPSDLSRELEQVLKAISLAGEKGVATRFLPIDRINTLVAIAPNPGVFDQIEVWLKKLDIPPKTTSGGLRNYVYRLKYGYAETLAGAIMQLYLGLTMPGFYSPFSRMGMGMYPGMGYGPGSGYNRGYGWDGMGYGRGYGYGYGYPGAYGGMDYGAYGYGAYGYGGYGMGYPGNGYPQGTAGAAGQTAAGAAGTTAQGTTAPADLTGSYLGFSRYGVGLPPNMPRVIPNPFDNTLLIQATPQDYEQIVSLIEQLDIAPRQILVEAKIYEVDLTGQFASGVQAFLQRRTNANRQFEASLETVAGLGSAVTASAGMLVGQSRELLAAVIAAESKGHAKLVSAPSLIATDSIPATLNVGDEVPTLSAQAINPGLQEGGNSLFTQSITNRQTGVTLNVLARANPSGVVTLTINQQVSAPVPASADAAIPSPSFSNRTVSTQVTMEDGDTIAIGGIISESHTYSSSGIPVLHRIPVLGYAFGNKTISTKRTELLIFMTPHVIHDMNHVRDASEELKSGFKKLKNLMPE